MIFYKCIIIKLLSNIKKIVRKILHKKTNFIDIGKSLLHCRFFSKNISENRQTLSEIRLCPEKKALWQALASLLLNLLRT